MVASSFRPSLTRHIVPAVAILVGIGVAAGIATAPGMTLDGVVERSGVAAVLPAATPPVGVSGRVVLALAAGALIAALGFAGRLAALFAPRLTTASGSAEAPIVIRRADAHPDAPPRRPIRAADMTGVPRPIEVTIEPAPRSEQNGRLRKMPAEPTPPPERPLPGDLDQPMAAFDPGAVPAEPQTPHRAPPPLTREAPAAESMPPVVILLPAPREEEQSEAVPSNDAVDHVVAVEPAEAMPWTPVKAETVAEAPARAPAGEDIASLLDRLERATRRPPPTPRTVAPDDTAAAAPSAPPPADVDSLDDTLARLRRLAAR